MNYITLVVGAKDDERLAEPFLHEVTEEDGGFYIDFRSVFKQCAEDVFFGKTQVMKILNLDIEKRVSDLKIKEHELDILIGLYLGDYEKGNSIRSDLIELLLSYWSRSGNFQEKSAVALEDLDLGINMKNKYKVLSNFDNELPIENLRELYRFILTENYKPVEWVVLNQYHKICDKIFKTNRPLVYYISSGEPKAVQVMYGTALYIPDIREIAKEGIHAYSL